MNEFAQLGASNKWKIGENKGSQSYWASDAPTLSAGRKTLLPMGTSIVGQNVRSMVGSTTTAQSETRGGVRIIPVASASAFSVNDKVAIGLCFGAPHLSTVTAVDAVSIPNTITIAEKIPRLVRSGGAVHRFTTDRIGNLRRTVGPFSAAVAQLGGPVEILPGYGYGGSEIESIVADLPAFLAFYRPDYVMFALYENSVASGKSFSKLLRLTTQAARACLKSGATPIIFSCMPNNSINSAGTSLVFDQIKQAVIDIDQYVPGAVGINISDFWLDKSLPNARQPIAGWTDGVHPNASRYQTIGSFIAPKLQELFGQRASYDDLALELIDMSGSGGTQSGLQGGSIVSAGTSLTAQAGVTASAYKSGNDTQIVDFTIPGASNVGTTQILWVSSAISIPASFGGQWVIGFIRFKVNAATNIDMYQCYIAFSDGTGSNFNQDSTNGSDGAYIGNELAIESAAVRVPAGSTSVSIGFSIRPQTLASPSGVAGNVEIIESGFMLAAAGEITETVGFL